MSDYINRIKDIVSESTNGSNELNNTYLYYSPESRFSNDTYADPLALNFKIMIDFTKTSGLVADESNVNSALAYLKRIGETTRYELLKRWISVLKDIINDNEYLVDSVEGLDVIFNSEPWHMYTDEDKISINFRETIDMRMQSIFAHFQQIWFDSVRVVEVLPSNLRKFDLGILVFSAGYYNNFSYDVLAYNKFNDTIEDYSGEITSKNFDRFVLPTKQKLYNLNINSNIPNREDIKFNHYLFTLKSVEIDHQETGKNFWSNISNFDSNTQVNTQLTIKFKFAEHSGMFNNLFEGFDPVKYLVIATIIESTAKNNNSTENTEGTFFEDKTVKEKLKDNLESIGKNLFSSYENFAENRKNKIIKIGTNYLDMYGNTLINSAGNLAKNIVDTPLDIINDAENLITRQLQNVATFANNILSTDVSKIIRNALTEENKFNNIDEFPTRNYNKIHYDNETLDNINSENIEFREKINIDGMKPKSENITLFNRKTF